MQNFQPSAEAPEKEMEEIEGTVEDVVYQNESNGYIVCELSLKGNELITAVGIMPYLREGELIKAKGKWENHRSYGRQFHVEIYEKQLPTTSEGILQYLSTGIVKGIGRKLAQKIVDKFGEDTFDVIENNPEWLSDIPGISQSKADDIAEEFKKQFGIRSVMLFCKDFFGPATAVKVYKRWGGSAVDVIKENPYSLCGEIYGIGFERADKIASQLGAAKDSEFRIKAGIKYLLAHYASDSGHCYIPRNKFTERAAEMLDVEIGKIENPLNELISCGEVIYDTANNHERLYLKVYYDAEHYSSEKLDLLDKVAIGIEDCNIERFIEQIEAEGGISYAPLQKKAIKSAINNGVMVLTGGPGTGKTTIIRGIINIVERLGIKIALAAPTGRAAKRMSEATVHEAKTIHRLLEVEFPEDESKVRFGRNENNLLEEEFIIIDETSMLDILLLSSLLKATKPGSHLIFIGDADQLPSVGAGNVLKNIIDSERFETVKLTEIFRQAGESMIVTNAHSINTGELPYLDNHQGDDFYFITRKNDHDISLTIVDLIKNRLPKAYGKQIIDEIQVISPSKIGESGTATLNGRIQNSLNPADKNKKERKKDGTTVFRMGDKVMQTKNDYNLEWIKDDGSEGSGVFNGDIGTVEDIDNTDGSIVVRYDDKTVEYDSSNLDGLELAYVITVHKSQGSEYPVVIIPVYDFSPRLMTRNLLYTAITRAQKMVILVGMKPVVQKMVNNNTKTKRYTALGELLRATMQ